MSSYIIIVCLIQGFFAVTGSKGLKKIQWAATSAFLLLGLYQTYVVFSHWNAAALISWKPTEVLMAPIGILSLPVTFALLIDLMIAYNWTWEFIGDFSRFAKTKKAGTWGPFVGALTAQLLWFTVGAVAVVYLAVSTGTFSPLLADPSSTTVTLGLGWLAAFIVLFMTVSTNAGNIYATALGVSNIISHKKDVSLSTLLVLVSLTLIPLAFSPLFASSFVGFYIFFLDFLGAIVVPLWTIILVDYFFVRKQKYTDDLFKLKGGAYWYKNGWNHSGVIALLCGTAMYWLCGYALPEVRNAVTATLPTVAFVTLLYLGLTKRNEGK
jgi:purine-cytosine permease-like protein